MNTFGIVYFDRDRLRLCMTAAHEYDSEPVTERMHDNSWSANLEQPQHAENRELVERQAIDAVEHTVPGNYVNLVTHGDHGHPSAYLYETLDEASDVADIDWEYIKQCGCGGHVLRVDVQ